MGRDIDKHDTPKGNGPIILNVAQEITLLFEGGNAISRRKK